MPLKTRSRASSSGPRRGSRARRRGAPAATRPSASRCRRRAPPRAAARRRRPGRPPRSAECRRGRARSPRRAAARRRGERSPAAAGSARSASTARSACCSCDERERGVEDDHRRRSRPRAPRPRRERERRRQPEQQCERMRELGAAGGANARPPPASSFGPYATSLRAASREVSPPGLERRSPNSTSTGSSTPRGRATGSIMCAINPIVRPLPQRPIGRRRRSTPAKPPTDHKPTRLDRSGFTAPTTVTTDPPGSHGRPSTGASSIGPSATPEGRVAAGALCARGSRRRRSRGHDATAATPTASAADRRAASGQLTFAAHSTGRAPVTR